MRAYGVYLAREQQDIGENDNVEGFYRPIVYPQKKTAAYINPSTPFQADRGNR